MKILVAAKPDTMVVYVGTSTKFLRSPLLLITPPVVMKAKSGDDTGDDTNDVVMEDSKSKQQKEKKKEPLLICGDRKRDVRNGIMLPYCIVVIIIR